MRRGLRGTKKQPEPAVQSPPPPPQQRAASPPAQQKTELPEIMEDQKYMPMTENLGPQTNQIPQEEPEVRIPELMRIDSLNRAMDFPLPMMRGDSIFSNVTPEELLQGNNILGGLSRQASVANRPPAYHSEDSKEYPGLSINISPKAEAKSEPKSETRDNK